VRFTHLESILIKVSSGYELIDVEFEVEADSVIVIVFGYVVVVIVIVVVDAVVDVSADYLYGT
jgi:hypothetical protein